MKNICDATKYKEYTSVIPTNHISLIFTGTSRSHTTSHVIDWSANTKHPSAKNNTRIVLYFFIASIWFLVYTNCSIISPILKCYNNRLLKSNILSKYINYLINIQSPNEKNLYLFSTAVLYTFIVLSKPINADTSIISVDFGKWKLVIKASTTLNLYGG